MISIVIPVFNEEHAILNTLNELSDALKSIPDKEIIVVNDGSKDNTLQKLKEYGLYPIEIINHVENLGYGKSLYDGIKVAKYDCITIIDGDGSYDPHDIIKLNKFFPEYDMVVGARTGKEYKKGFVKKPARLLFKFLVEYTIGKTIPDVNSGLRIFKKNIVMDFHDSLCTGFSFTTTLTLIFWLNNFFVKYIPIKYLERTGKSKINHFRDTLRAGQIIVEAILNYNPVKLFLLLAVLNLCLGATLELVNFFLIKNPWISIISAICIASFVPVFSLGLIASQIRKVSNVLNSKG
jgi:polyisoprenyl-phosphate glycosyltransferase